MRRRVEARLCSIVEAGTDCVVNASNESATLGGGVSRAFFEECGGRVLQEEMRAKLDDEFDGELDEGDCLLTSSGTSTRFRHVLHVAAVSYGGVRARLGPRGVERTVTSAERIEACTVAALEAAARLAAQEGRSLSIAFPLLGAGSGGLTPAMSCHAMIAGMRAFFRGATDAPRRRVLAVPEPDRHEVCSRLVAANSRLARRSRDVSDSRRAPSRAAT